MILPDYHGGSITNLMATLGTALTDKDFGYESARLLPPQAIDAYDHIVLMVVDGLGYNLLRRVLPDSALAQHCVGSITSVCPTTTASAIPTFLTGVAPLQHGLTGWFTYFAELGAVLTVLPFNFRFGQVPLDQQGISPAMLAGAGNFFDAVNVECSVVSPAWIAHSSFNRAFSGAAKIRPYNDLKGLFKAIRAGVGSRKRRSYTYAYWSDYDSVAHTYGCDSEQAINQLRGLNEHFEKLLESLKGSRTKLIVTADHGFIDSCEVNTIQLNDHPQLRATLAVPLCGEPRLAFAYVHADRVSEFESYVKDNFSDACHLVKRTQMLQENWFGLGEAYQPTLNRVGHYGLVMKDNYKITSALPGERRLSHIGVHGGLSADEMQVPLIVADL